MGGAGARIDSFLAGAVLFIVRAHRAAGADRHHAVFESKAGEQNETGEQTGEQNHVLLLFSEGTSNPFIPTTEPARRLSLPISL